MNSEQISLLREISESSPDNLDYTHYTYLPPSQCWKIPNTEYTRFWSEYCRLSKNTFEVGNGKLCIAERQLQEMPVTALFKFVFSGSDKTFVEYYDDYFIMSLVKCYQKAIQECYILSSEANELMCVILEPSDSCVRNGDTVVNIRLHFPYAKIEQSQHLRILRPLVIDYLRKENPYRDLHSQPKNDWDDIIDLNFMSNPVPLYGSVSVADESPLIHTRIVPEVGDDDYDNIDEYTFRDIFYSTAHEHVIKGIVNDDMFHDQDDVEFWFPMMLSLHYCTVILKLKPKYSRNLNYHNIDELRKSNSVTPELDNNSNKEDRRIDIAIKLLNTLDISKIQNEDYWLNIGRALHRCDNEIGGEGYKAWVTFSKSGGREEYQCEAYWDIFEVKNTISYETIGYYSAKDNPKMYKIWHDNTCNKHIDALMKNSIPTDDDLSKAFYWLHWLDFKCSNSEKKIWYYYRLNATNDDKRTHRWVPCDDALPLKRSIGKDFYNKMWQRQKFYSDEGSKDHNEGNKEKYAQWNIKMGKIILSLRNNATKKKIIESAKQFFKDDNFIEYSDNNDDLFGIANGVFEVLSDKAIFRDGKPEDYITKSSPVVFHPEYTWDHPRVKPVMRWLEELFPDPDLLDYVLKLLGSTIRSGNGEKLFPCFTGKGNNGKSMFKQLLENVFGCYAFTYSNDMLTAKGKNNGRSNVQKALSKDCKIVFAQEPSLNSALDDGAIKENTGLDSTYGSLLYDNGGNFIVKFLFIFICNKIPIIPGADKAIYKRFRAVPFLSTWDDENIPSIPDEQMKQRRFKADPTFSRRIKFMTSGMIWILFQYLNKYLKEGLQEPAVVTEHTTKYWEVHDIYKHFTRVCMDKVIIPDSKTDKNPEGKLNPNVLVSTSDVCKTFRKWLSEAYPDIDTPNNPAIIYELDQRWGETVDDHWKGYSIKEDYLFMSAMPGAFNKSSFHP